MKHTPKHITLTIAFLTATLAYTQNTPLTTKEIVNQIAEKNYVAPFPDGFFYGETPQYKLFVQLKETATTDELVKYTEDKRPIVRVHAIKSLDDRKYEKLFELAQRHIHDTGKVKTTGHMSRDTYVGDYFVEVQNITEIERHQLDSILLYTDNQLFYLNRLLLELEPNEQYYERIRHLARKNRFAVIALARFKKASDIDLIATRVLKNSHFTIEAIEIFPAEPFKKTLLTLREQGYNYYGTELAVAAFKDSFSVDYFNTSLNSLKDDDFERSQKSEYISEAITKYRDTIYTDLFFRMWKDDCMINSETFNYLIDLDKDKSLNLAKYSLQNPDNLSNSTLVISTMLDSLIANDRPSAKKIIKKNIDSTNVHKLKYFVEKAVHFKNPDIISAMFYRLENTSNGHIYVPIIKTVLTYQDQELNDRLIKSIHLNTEIKGWGLEKVVENLEVYGLEL